jgi:hypothetical protein
MKRAAVVTSASRMSTTARMTPATRMTTTASVSAATAACVISERSKR